jgi:hypothetical protein
MSNACIPVFMRANIPVYVYAYVHVALFIQMWMRVYWRDYSLRKQRVLCLHGYMNNGDILKRQLTQLIDATAHFVSYEMLDAPYAFSFTSTGSLPRGIHTHSHQTRLGNVFS